MVSLVLGPALVKGFVNLFIEGVEYVFALLVVDLNLATVLLDSEGLLGGEEKIINVDWGGVNDNLRVVVEFVVIEGVEVVVNDETDGGVEEVLEVN